jgi:hypothetical protein
VVKWKVMTTSIGDAQDAGTLQDQEVVYRVDRDARLTFVNPRWDGFAVSNGAPELLGAALLGRRVTDFIRGPETQMIYDLIIRRAAGGASVTLPYRCDAPAERRRMMLTVAACPPDGIEFRSRLVESEHRDPVRLLEPGWRRDPAMLLTLCSWCNRGRVREQWMEIEDVVSALGLFEDDVPQVTHGMCPACVELVTAAWS